MSIGISANELILKWITNTYRFIEEKEISTHPSVAPTPKHNLTFHQLFIYWNRLSSSGKKAILLSSITLFTSYYILAPTIFPPKKMFTKRPDKHTTGLINLRNDCFANSSLQAYLSLPGLTEYLNKFIGAYDTIKSLLPDSKVEEEIEKDQAKRGIPLHIALAKILKKLQETQLTTRTVSVWTFLHTLETIFHAKISRSQHDAHELTQLINETLENENLSLQTLLKTLLEKDDKEVNIAIKEQLSGLEVPEFPLSGLTLTHMVCLTCKHVSTPSFVPFLMLTLNTPEKFNTELETILDENESETIEGYQCLKCRISKIVANEEQLKTNDESTGDDKDMLTKIYTLNKSPQFCINDDLPKELEEYIKSYKKGGLDISKITSTVMRKNQILKPPKIFGIHLSRSSFDGVKITRNSCRVAFKDQLTLSIGKEYIDELQKFKEDSSKGKKEGINIKSKVLTTDVNDMEDEEVQREDIDEKGEEEDDEFTGSSATDTDGNSGDNHTDETDEAPEAELDDDSSSLTSTESVGGESVTTSATLKGGSTITATPLIFSEQATSSRVPETLNNAPITEDQTDDLKGHFKSFKFNDNDVYKYRLKALIRHQGSHTQGHYECYKRKPLFVKDKDGTIFKLSPEIDDDLINDERETEKHEGSDGNNTVAVKPMSSEDHQRFINSSDNGELKAGSNQFRRRFSSIMGRRPSVVQSHHSDLNIQEIIHSGSQTPAEILVDNPEQEDYFSAFKDPFSQDRKRGPSKAEKKVKMTKIPSLIKNPYWRISDSQIVEVSRSAVLFETGSVYMLYYERVDRKQIKR